jgi:hypothetical protein
VGYSDIVQRLIHDCLNPGRPSFHWQIAQDLSFDGSALEQF